MTRDLEYRFTGGLMASLPNTLLKVHFRSLIF